MKRTFFISFGLVIALSLSLFCSCGDKNKVACEITLNTTIYKLIKMIEKHGDNVVSDFHIILDENNEFLSR